MRPPYLNRDPQDKSPQYLEDLATGYWFSEILFTAVEMDIFTLLEPAGKNAPDIAGITGCSLRGMERFLQALCALGLINRNGEVFYNAAISRQYLVKDREDYQGDSILWRKYLASYWQGLEECIRSGGRVIYPSDEDTDRLVNRVRRYIRAMDGVARTKAGEILPIFDGLLAEGEILDVGAGSGAVAAGFLERFPGLGATLADLPEVLDLSRELMEKRGIVERVSFCSINILDPWPFGKGRFDLVILSNIIHAYSESEVPHILAGAAECLKADGFLLIHDFFPGHSPQKAALSDLNMLINTYNGMVFSESWVLEKLDGLGLHATGLVPLATDTALIIASKYEQRLSGLRLDLAARLASKIRDLGFGAVHPIPVQAVHIPGWADLRCRYGCELYGRPHCPPNSPTPGKTRAMLKDYTQAFLLEGEPPTAGFQRRVLQAEREAFRQGYYKAFAFWAGPCSLCDPCPAGGQCRNARDSRPSMEGAGIDVFETAKRSGIPLKTLENRGDFIKYFALLLLE
ncbi:MAG: DUF2284 domain-containing protein [Bacillota bacterium]